VFDINGGIRLKDRDIVRPWRKTHYISKQKRLPSSGKSKRFLKVGELW